MSPYSEWRVSVDFWRFRMQILFVFVVALWHTIFYYQYSVFLVAGTCSVLQLTALFNSLRSACFGCQNTLPPPQLTALFSSLWSACFGCRDTLTLPSDRCVAPIICPELLSGHPCSPWATNVLHSSFASPPTTAALWCFALQAVYMALTHPPVCCTGGNLL
jgi:hypothetical protein